MTAADPAARQDILRREAEALRARVAAAQASLELIQCAVDCGQEDITRCGHFRQSVAERTGG
ncbi:hypothetical protein ACFQ0X_04380 [Streptomyces rectiviolaceus]|uniref:Uncharacterized protein n=1 Tax=Streptomyces rectiviolaceus TaxID=332591 RepID=A0ABP6M8Z3_9ACTN